MPDGRVLAIASAVGSDVRVLESRWGRSDLVLGGVGKVDVSTFRALTISEMCSDGYICVSQS